MYARVNLSRLRCVDATEKKKTIAHTAGPTNELCKRQPFHRLDRLSIQSLRRKQYLSWSSMTRTSKNVYTYQTTYGGATISNTTTTTTIIIIHGTDWNLVSISRRCLCATIFLQSSSSCWLLHSTIFRQ